MKTINSAHLSPLKTRNFGDLFNDGAKEHEKLLSNDYKSQ